ncbi:MAG: hypothetical protein LPD71_14040, partial [Shewanella sp.]|nr:hypothetical protein [Shewanella sp.]
MQIVKLNECVAQMSADIANAASQQSVNRQYRNQLAGYQTPCTGRSNCGTNNLSSARELRLTAHMLDAGIV